MRQIIQNIASGETCLSEHPVPSARMGSLLMKTECSLISLGTERMLINFGKANLLSKARQQPDKVKQVLDKVKTDGLLPTIETVRAKLDTPLPLGYCNVGRVIEVGEGVEGFSVGDRVLSNGPHAEIVCVSKNLCAKVPENVESESAAYGVVGSIALQGIRLLEPTIGETHVVTGLGLIGQLAVQILLANGCNVIGIDFDQRKCDLAESFGAKSIKLSADQNPIKIASALTESKGVDGVLITASTKSNEPIHQAAQMCRKRGRIVLVGVVGMEFNRSDFYEKELSFQVSCSYGPGRYDPNYEQGGNDYPLGFVRWTEQRNFEAILNLMSTDRIKTDQLTTSRHLFKNALDAYNGVDSGTDLGIILEYPQHDREPGTEDRLVRLVEPTTTAGAKATVGMIGAGSFTGLMILPAIKKANARLKVITSSTGVSGTHLGKKFNFESSATDNELVFSDSEVNTVFITTRHSNHGSLVLKALESGKHVFVEKPLCIKRDEFNSIKEWYKAHSSNKTPLLMVGFNRRFSPLIMKMDQLLVDRSTPLAMTYNVNAGMIPRDHWSQIKSQGGGRVLGEVCHFIDLLRFLAKSKIRSVNASYARKSGNVIDDIVTVNLTFEDGSIGNVNYFANGNKSLERESLDVYCGGGILRMNNFRTLRGYKWPGFKKQKLSRQDKGHRTEISEFIYAIENGKPAPISLEEIFEVTEASFTADEQSKA